MKKKVQDYILSLKASCHYSGRKQTMFITDNRPDKSESIISLVFKKFGSLPFKLAENETSTQANS